MSKNGLTDKNEPDVSLTWKQMGSAFSSEPGSTRVNRSGDLGFFANDLRVPLFNPGPEGRSVTPPRLIRVGIICYVLGIVTYAVGSCQLYGGQRTVYKHHIVPNATAASNDDDYKNDDDQTFLRYENQTYCDGAWGWKGWGVIGCILIVSGLLAMTISDTDLNQHTAEHALSATCICAAHMVNAGITAFSIPPVSYVHFFRWIPWLYFLFRYDQILKREGGYLRYTEIFSLTFVCFHLTWGLYFFITAWRIDDQYFLILGILFLLAALVIVCAYRSYRKESPTARCYIAIFSFLISWGVCDLAYGIFLSELHLPPDATKWATPVIFLVPTLAIVLFYQISGSPLAPRHLDLGNMDSSFSHSVSGHGL
jgi:hypothetical protein